MTIRAPGTVSIDGVNYQLTKQKDTNAWYWHYDSSIAPPQQVTPEETILSSTQSGYKRTAGWLDWSHGGVGPSVYQANVRWLASSQGPITEYARKIVQPIKLQSTDSAGAALTLELSYGRIVDFAVGPVEQNGTQLIFALQELGCARRVTFNQTTTTSAITIGLATQPTSETSQANKFGGTGQFAAGTGSPDWLSNGFAIGTTLLNITEGGPLWSYPVSSVLTPHLLVGADHITASPTVNASFFLYKAGGASSNGVWRQAGVVGTPSTGILRGRFQVGMYASGPLLWASASTTAVESVSSYGAGVLNVPAQQDPTVLGNWTTDLFGILTSGYTGRRIGADQSAIVSGITILRDAVLVATNDGMFYKLMTSGDLAGVPVPLIDSKAAIPEADSGRTMTSWNGMVYIPTARGLFMFQEFGGKDGGTLVGVGPEFIPGNQSAIRGKCVLYAGDPQYLYASFYNGTDSYIMKGRMAKDGEEAPGIMIWHAACPYVNNAEVTAIVIAQPKHTGKTNPVLILGCKAATYTLRYVILPRIGQSLLTDSMCLSSVLGSYEAILPEHDAMAPSLLKTFLRLNVITSGLSYSGGGLFGMTATEANLTLGETYTVGLLGTSTNTAVAGSDWNVVGGTTGVSPATNIPRVYAAGDTFVAAATGAGTGNGAVYKTNSYNYNVVQVYYKVDSADWIALGTITFSPLVNIPFPPNIVGYKLSIKFIFKGNVKTFSYIEAVSFDFVQRVTPARTVSVQVLANPSKTTASGPTRASASGSLSYLEQLKDEGETFEVIGPDGKVHYAQIDQSTGISWRPSEQGHPDAFPNIGYTAQFKLNLYDDFVSRNPAKYGDDDSTPPVVGSSYSERGIITLYDDNVIV